MSDATVIDQLVVKLGLDPSGFTKGQKAAAAALVETEQQAKKSGDSIAQSFLSAAGKIVGITTAILAIKKVVGYVDDISESIRRLGINAANFDTSAAKLRNFQNAAELVGGSAEEITKTIGNLQKSIFDLSYNGEVSSSLIMLGRLGVQFQDASGHARDFTSVLLDTADAIGAAQKNGMSHSEAFNYLQESGFDQGSIQLILSGRANAQAELAKQAARNQVTGGNFNDATTIQRAKIGVGQAATAEVGLRTLRPTAAVIEGLQNPEETAKRVLGLLDDVASKAADGVEGLTHAIGGLVDKVKDYAGGGTVDGKHYSRSDFDGAVNAAAKKYGIDPAVLAGVINTESRYNPNAQNAKSGARGIAQLNPKYHPEAGKNPVADIYTAAQVLSQNKANFAHDGNDEDASWELALQAYNAGEQRVRSANAGGKPLTAETQAYAGKVLGYAQAHPTPGVAAAGGASGGNTTTVEINSMTVTTAATDADGMAAGAEAALQRKLMSSHSEQGLQ